MNARKIPFLLFLFVIFLIPFSAEAAGDQTNPNLFPVTVEKILIRDSLMRSMKEIPEAKSG